jgi:hypothetical protein
MNESTWLRLVPANSAKVSCDILANDRFGLFVLAMVGQQQKRTRQPFLGGSERLFRGRPSILTLRVSIYEMKVSANFFLLSHQCGLGRHRRGRRCACGRIAADTSLCHKITGAQ